MKRSSIALIAALVLLAGCATTGSGQKNPWYVGANVEGGRQQEQGPQSRGAYAANGYYVVVMMRGYQCMPLFVQSASVTCLAQLPYPHNVVAHTNADGVAYFSIAGPPECWVDWEGKRFPVPAAGHNSETEANRNIIKFWVPGGEDCSSGSAPDLAPVIETSGD